MNQMSVEACRTDDPFLEATPRAAVPEQSFDERFGGLGHSERHLRGPMPLKTMSLWRGLWTPESARQRLWGPKPSELTLTPPTGDAFLQ
jgi:hypothetical protein